MSMHAPLKNAIHVRAQAPCPMCDQDSWAAGEGLLTLAEGEAGASPLDVLAFVCTHCGFVRLHAVQPLETIDD